MKWTKAYRKTHGTIIFPNFLIGKEMVKDTCFEFEKKRNEPLVYNRDLYVNTI